MKNRYGKEVLVTGAGSGLGLACAEAFAASGCHVVGVSRSCKEETRKVGAGSIDTMKMDVNDDESIRRVVETMPRVDIVVHCAGFGIAGAAEDTPIDLASAQMETNYFGVLRTCAFDKLGRRAHRHSVPVALFVEQIRARGLLRSAAHGVRAVRDSRFAH